MVFADSDPPPFYDLECPKRDFRTGKMKVQKTKTAKTTATTLRKQMGADLEHAEPEKEEVEIIRAGYVGQPKGVALRRPRALSADVCSYPSADI